MKQVGFKQVDVFTSKRYKGNPVAVVLQADDLTDEQMQQIAHWTNLSETTFVIAKTQAEADYRVRIFTPGSELPFAGHPTIGTAHALIEAGLVTPKNGVLIQECGAGLIKLDVKVDASGSQQIAFELPTPKISPLDDGQVDRLEASLGTPILREFTPCLVDVGARWVVAQLVSAEAVLQNRPALEPMKVDNLEAKATGVIIFGEYKDEGPADVEVRAYAPACGVSEDPVCGSGNGAMAAFIRHTGQTGYFGESVQASQGLILGRAGTIHLNIQDQTIRVGGEAVTCIDGSITLA
ncbi:MULTISPECIES: PhzF family phenazine biosynthesis protein [unclassified Pseudomonas]|uniref:PhzF family phenazine biosynthesis protein n=1 Tax=unclassified Pseudomonas TaxID=196821 RepID=UPI000D8EF626|nr:MULTISPECIES: PhzF family phenazine biosynthesis protein [unclassified Pseudomonas]PYG78416.1 PhzF family phenazine biosynthesis protein [Pseudomonas sp. RV120224-01c]PYG82643.1 PhzF family phenazine biosynthesis protein [Pseudomonas sp. RV120224-01b]